MYIYTQCATHLDRPGNLAALQQLQQRQKHRNATKCCLIHALLWRVLLSWIDSWLQLLLLLSLLLFLFVPDDAFLSTLKAFPFRSFGFFFSDISLISNATKNQKKNIAENLAAAAVVAVDSGLALAWAYFWI